MEKIALIHGLNSHSTVFDNLIRKLPNTEIFDINYNSTQPLEKSLFECLTQLPEEPIHLIGYSLGGVIATILAAAFSNAKSLTTISSPLGGSYTASFLKMMPFSFPILRDICKTSKYINFCKQVKLDIPTLSVVSVDKSIPFPIERGDGILTYSSQTALGFAKHVEIDSNHFDVLEHPKTLDTVSNFILGN